jgi:hypothetical protein
VAVSAARALDGHAELLPCPSRAGQDSPQGSPRGGRRVKNGALQAAYAARACGRQQGRVSDGTVWLGIERLAPGTAATQQSGSDSAVQGAAA